MSNKTVEIQNLLKLSEDNLLALIGRELDSGLHAKPPSQSALVRTAQKWFDDNRGNFQHKVCNDKSILKHVKKTRQNPQGGRLQKESPMRVSNVRLICPLCSEKTVAAMRRNEEGKRVRYCKKCDEEI